MTESLFFYGTLCHPPLLALVLGRAVGEGTRPARLDGFQASWVKGQPFPMIAVRSGASTKGVLVSGLTEDEIARLDFYEGGFDYDLQAVTVRAGGDVVASRVYVPTEGVWQPGTDWDLKDWEERFGQMTLLAAAEVMDRYGKTPESEIRSLFPFIRSRAWARIMAREGAPCILRSSRGMSDLELLGERPGYDGFFRIKAFDLRFRRFDGAFSAAIGREAFVAFDAALLLPYDPRTDKVLLIEQLRFGPIQRGDPYPWILEPIAGLVDANEDPASCARREALEEANLTLTDLRHMLRVYASPGYSTEYFHCFLGLCDLSGHMGGVHGLASENEDIRSHVLGFEQAMGLVESGEINAGPLAMMLLWLAQHRQKLRAEVRG